MNDRIRISDTLAQASRYALGKSAYFLESRLEDTITPLPLHPNQLLLADLARHIWSRTRIAGRDLVPLPYIRTRIVVLLAGLDGVRREMEG